MASAKANDDVNETEFSDDDERETGGKAYLCPWIVKLEESFMAPKWSALLNQRHWDDRVNRLFKRVYGDVRCHRPIEHCVAQMVNDFLGRGLIYSFHVTPFTHLEILEGLEAELELEEDRKGRRLDQRILTVHVHIDANGHGPLPAFVDHSYAVALHQAASQFGIWNPITKRFTDASRMHFKVTAMQRLKDIERDLGIVPPNRPLDYDSPICNSSDEELSAYTFGTRLNNVYARVLNFDPRHVDTHDLSMEKLVQVQGCRNQRNEM